MLFRCLLISIAQGGFGGQKRVLKDTEITFPFPSVGDERFNTVLVCLAQVFQSLHTYDSTLNVNF